MNDNNTISSAGVVPVSVSESTLTVDKRRRAYNIDVSTDTLWGASTESSWLSLASDPNRESAFTIFMEENDTGVSRTGNVVVTTKLSDTATITVTQEPTVWNPNTFAPSELFFAKHGGAFDTYLTAPNAWTCNPQCGWVHLKKPTNDAGTEFAPTGSGLGTLRPDAVTIANKRDKIALRVVCDENTSGFFRTYKMRVENVRNGAVASVYQLGEDPSLGAQAEIPATRSVESDVELVSWPVSPNAPFKATSSAEWCDASFSYDPEIQDSTFLDISFQANTETTERTTTVTITPDTDAIKGLTEAEVTAATKTIVITQAAATTQP